MKTVYMFPGQGSQEPGMGLELYKSNSLARSMMDRADELLGFSLTDMMFRGTEEQLKETVVAQPAIFVCSVCQALCSGAPLPDMVGGHSLGEYSALVVSKALDYEDALLLVQSRANAMQKCCNAGMGTMAAVIGLSDAQVEAVCSEIPGVVPANYNSDGQVVISGESAAVEAASARLLESGARLVKQLSVGGAFHSPMMEAARKELGEAIERTSFHNPCCPVYQNVTAAPEIDALRIKANLLSQLTSPVKWTQSVKAMISDGADCFVEFGPGDVLTGLVKRIAKSMAADVTLKKNYSAPEIMEMNVDMREVLCQSWQSPYGNDWFGEEDLGDGGFH